MGACCNGKESKNDRIEEEICTKHTRVQILTEYVKNNIPKIEMEVEKTNLNGTLTDFIHKHMNSFEHINMKKLSLEQLWNVCKFYLDDFTNSEYILYDLREKKDKKEIQKIRLQKTLYNNQVYTSGSYGSGNINLGNLPAFPA